MGFITWKSKITKTKLKKIYVENGLSESLIGRIKPDRIYYKASTYSLRTANKLFGKGNYETLTVVD